MKTKNLRDMDLGIGKSLCIRTKDRGVYLISTQFIGCVDKQGNFNGSYGVVPETLSQMLNDFKRFTVMSSFNDIEPKVFELNKISELYSVAAHPTKKSVVEIVKPKKSYFGRMLYKLNNVVR